MKTILTGRKPQSLDEELLGDESLDLPITDTEYLQHERRILEEGRKTFALLFRED